MIDPPVFGFVAFLGLILVDPLYVILERCKCTFGLIFEHSDRPRVPSRKCGIILPFHSPFLSIENFAN